VSLIGSVNVPLASLVAGRRCHCLHFSQRFFDQWVTNHPRLRTQKETMMMTFLVRTFRSWIKAACRPKPTFRKANRRVRLGLEGLEDRTVPATFHVNSLLDVGSGAGLIGDLRYCINQANATAGHNDILFDLSGTINLQSQLPVITNAVDIGHDSFAKTINAQHASRAFQVAPNVTATIWSMTVTGGFVDPAWHNVSTDPNVVNPVPPGQPLAQDFRFRVAIVVDGQQFEIPPFIGLTYQGGQLVSTLPISTPDATDPGNVHVQSTVPASTHTFTLKDFFDTWGQPISSTQVCGYLHDPAQVIPYMTVNGVASAAFGNLVVHDGDQINFFLDHPTRAPQGNIIGDYQGGALFVDHANVTLNAVNLTGNYASSQGGAIYNDHGTVTINAGTVSGNSSTEGAAVANFNATMVGYFTTVNSNFATFGAAVYNLNSTVAFTYSTLAGNFGQYNGGALYNNYSVVALVNSTLSGNQTLGVGGAMYDFYAQAVALVNCTIAQNTAGAQGGGIYNDANTVVLVVWWGTLAENYASLGGGGIFNVTGGTASIFNTIIAKNTAGLDHHEDDVFGAFASVGHNLIGVGTGSTGFTAAGDLVGTTSAPIDPHLNPLANNGGFTQTYSLQANSLALNNGSTQFADLLDSNNIGDQRGGIFGYHRMFNGHVDIGAFETQPHP
jgi:hypothetical protein